MTLTATRLVVDGKTAPSSPVLVHAAPTPASPVHGSATPRLTDEGGGTNPRRDPAVDPVVVVRAVPPPRERFELLQQFEGTVMRIEGDEFQARYRDLTNPDQPDETAWFQQADIADGDRALLVLGGVFYWSIGYSVVGGTKRRTSEVRFRRLPAWSRTELAAAHDLAARWDHLLGPDGVR